MTALIIGFLDFLSYFVTNFVPTIELPSSGVASIITAIVTIMDLLGKANYFIAVDTFIAPVALVMAVKGSFVLFFIGNWVYTKITALIP